MDNQISDPNPVDGAAANPATDPAPVNGTVQPNGEANGQSASVEETFGNVDPKTLPPQLKQVYDNMLRGFKEKTTKLSETVKSETARAVEAFKQKAELYDQLAGQEEFVKLWNEHVQKVSAAQPQGDPKDPIHEKLQELEVKVHQAEAKEVISAFADAVDEKGQKLHGDFDKFNTFVVGTIDQGGRQKQVSLLGAAIELAPGDSVQEKIDNGYKAAKQMYDAIFEEGKKAGMGRVQDKARNGSLPPSGVNAGTTAPRRPKDALEALEFAQQGLAVHK